MLPNKENEQLWREMQDQTRPNLTPPKTRDFEKAPPKTRDFEKAKEDQTKNSTRTNEELIFRKKNKMIVAWRKRKGEVENWEKIEVNEDEFKC